MKCPNVSSISNTIVYLYLFIFSEEKGGKYGTKFKDLFLNKTIFFFEFFFAISIFFSKIEYKNIFRHISM